MELCDCNLEVFICQYPKEVPKDGFKQILEGLKVLHNNKFLHRDLKPSNVLVKKEKTEEGKLIVLKLSDFSLAKETDDEMSVISGLYIGTEGWIPPEIHQGTEVKPSNIVVNASADIFACGMLGYYVVSGGQMLYNSQEAINHDINQGNADYSNLHDPTTKDIVRAMTCRDESKRPNAKMCLKHPCHWDSARVFEYFKVVNDTIVSVDVHIKTQVSNALNQNPHQVFQSDWKSRLTPLVKNELFTAPRSSTRPKYNEFNVTDLIRAIRNTKEHFLQMKHLHNELGNNKNDLHAYWTGLFPYLLIHTYTTLKPMTMYGELQHYY
ncbi:serine/threonine-protein kinase/endoribonuclease IRE1-like [Mya arenaria]|nr:serine/threonine-protein kinase/endoribonuclease IRE1-like [Mya arenaria]